MAGLRWMLMLLWGLFLSGCGGCDIGCSGSGEPGSKDTTEGELSESQMDAELTVDEEPTGEVCARMIFLSYGDTERVPDGTTRSEDEARSLAIDLRRRVVEQGEDFGVLASEFSDKWSHVAGAFGAHTYQSWPQKYEWLRDAVFALEEEGVTPVLESKAGFVLAQRCPTGTVEVRHILLRYKGAFMAPEGVQRTKGEAMQRVVSLRERIMAGEDFAELAKANSEDAASATKGGYVGEVDHGFLSPEFQKEAFRLAIGEVSEVVETRFGFHIMERLEPAR
jgi:hypothetical protein